MPDSIERPFFRRVLNDGYVSLERSCVDRELIARIARISHGIETGDDEKTINFLLKHNHTGPLEASLLVFKVKAPIFVFRQWQRHRIGQGYTERSLRYCEAIPSFYCCGPSDQNVYEFAWNAYQQALNDGESKEKARRLLPVGIYTEMYWYPNLVALMHFLDLRLDKSAQLEIRLYAEAILSLLEQVIPDVAEFIALKKNIKGFVCKNEGGNKGE